MQGCPESTEVFLIPQVCVTGSDAAVQQTASNNFALATTGDLQHLSKHIQGLTGSREPPPVFSPVV